MRSGKKGVLKGALLGAALLLGSLCAAPAPVAAAEAAGKGSGVLRESVPNDKHYELISGAELSAATKLDLWHYSGGYWKVTNPGAGTVQVPDSVMGQGDSLVVPAQEASFTLNLPKQVREAVAAGETVVPVIQSASGAKLSELFELPGKFSMGADKMTFTARPKFHLVPSSKLSFGNTYGLHTSVTVPFIERKYGYNMYSVFGNGYQNVQVNGYADAGNPSSMAGMPAGWIHPSMIADTRGTIKAGYKLMINSKLLDSAGFSVGKGTFANAGAMGLCFEYPVKFSFYLYHEEQPEPEPDPPKPPAPEKIICQKCGRCELVAEGNCGEDTCPNWDTPDCGCYVPPEVDAEAILSVPGMTYEGHPVTASDQSRFQIDGEYRSAAEVYQEGYARNRFSIVESGSGTVSRNPDSRTEAEIVFPQKGIYHVQLRVTPRYGSSLYDTKPVEVEKTPTVLAALGGTQKQNRKQTLTVSVATDPNSPLESLFIELKHRESGETVRLVHNLKNSADNTLQNTALIKTRAIAAEASDRYWTRCGLEFLTKNAAAAEFTYRVYARDSRGMWDEAVSDFTVRPDDPPEAKIEVEPSFLRESKENRAVIQARDVSVTDGDQLERKWSAANTAGYDGISDVYSPETPADPFAGSVFSDIERLPGYGDNSFGTKQSVRFDRIGVGKIKLKLEVKDVWTEETLPEYITEDDYLTASAVAETEVVNAAPLVSMKPLLTKTGEVLLLAGGEREYEKLTEVAAELRTRLLENGVDAGIQVSRMTPAPETEEKMGALRAAGEASVAYGYQGSGDSFWEKGATLIDDTRLFKAEATWVKGERPEDCHPSMPFKIYAYDVAKEGELAPLWSCTVTSSLIGAEDDGAKAKLYQDEDGAYLYFVMAGKTVVIDKSTGAILTCLATEFGPAGSVGKNAIFTYKPDGVYRINMADGEIKRFAEAKIFPLIRRIAGEDHFMIKEGSTLMRGVIDPKREKMYAEPLLGARDDGRTTYTLNGIDAEGRMLVSCLAPAASSSDERELTLRVYGADNRLLKSSVCRINRQDDYAAAPVADGSGRYHYYALVRNAAGSAKYDRTYVNVWGIDTPCAVATELENKHGDGYPTMAENILLAEEREDGKVYLLTGAYREYWDSIDGYAGKAQGRSEKMRGFQFDPKQNTVSEYSPADGAVWQGLALDTEYGCRSDAYIALTTSDNHLDQEKAVSRTKVARRGQRVEDILLRSVNREISGKRDTAALLVYDETNEAACRNPKNFLEVLADKNLDYLFAGANVSTKYGLQLAEAAGERGKAVDAGNLTEVLLSALTEEETRNQVLQVKTASKDGNISREYRLSPNTQYFFEYDYRTSDVSGAGEPEDGASEAGVSKGRGTESGGEAAQNLLHMTARCEQKTPESGLLPEKYVVTDSFEEDFNDPKHLNPYFSGLSGDRTVGGQYNLAYFKESYKSNRYRGAEGTLSFTVPAGKQAVLSWDYDFGRDGATDWNMGYYIDGKLWNNTPAGSGFKGHYTHTELLSAGTHTLGAKTGAYGRNIEIWGKLDNLRVDWVELRRTAPAVSGSALETAASVQEQNGWRHVQGSFQTPGRAEAYTAVPTLYYSSNLTENTGDCYAWKSKAAGSKEIQLLFGDEAVDYAAVGFSINSNSSKAVSCKVGGSSFTSSAKSEPKDNMASIRGQFNAVLRDQTGTVTGTISHSTYNSSASGNFNRLETAKLRNGAARGIMEENRFFLASLENGKNSLFVENDRFEGDVTLRFAPEAAGSYQLRGLKIYSVRNGVKVYAEDSSLGERNAPLLWTADHAETAVVSSGNAEEQEQRKLVYQKGELVAFDVYYEDYENDPSKLGKWRYTHTPFNDGPHPSAAVILNADGTVKDMPGGELSDPIPRFYIDGKYTVEHWQEDNTRRGKTVSGNPDYDKRSNVASLTFYIQGGGTAPWVTHIGTVPAVVKEGERYRLKIGVDDAEKDELSLTAEVYYNGESVATFRKQGIRADSSGRYPDVVTEFAPLPAQAGRYEIVCTVRDRSGVGIKNYKFSVVSAGKVTGFVYHTDEWEQNRRQYNVRRFGMEYNQEVSYAEYKKQKPPRRRGTNVFWSGEKFMLQAAAGGSPDRVTCSIAGSGYSTQMKYTGRKNAEGERIYEGTLWNSGMMHKWGRGNPEELTFRFRARYENGTEKLCDVKVIVDQFDEYWQLHRFS